MKNKKIEQIEFVCSLPGVDINIADNSLKTPLFYAIATGSLEIVKYICSIQNVNYNVVNSAIFAFLYFFGVFFFAHETPLSFAQKREKSSPEMTEIIQLLKEKM